MELGHVLSEGKTKIVYAHPTDPDLAILFHKDGITAGDGARRHVIAGKGALAGQTTANVFRFLNRAGIATHFIEAPEPKLTVVRRCVMIPLEVVMRRLPAGSYLRRYPEAAGQRFDPPLVEFFLKDDARHDPQITPDEIVAQGIATPAEVEQMTMTGQQVFTTLEAAWAKLDVTLVDLKIEFGRAGDGSLLVADVIDNDSWRIWPGGDPNRMLDKQVYRNAQVVDEDVLADVYARYAQVAELTGRWDAVTK
ncbi:phosphoribosylaminoimidazolesuccinocarboxamide synthase [Chloroflexus aggregans]|uniref:Phosphoribosylaminoimidazole-succinocarboxamide synthase n=1 Tax=Chloroflexus aggregans (strain MD-66 / DSM 9485) TaxID=326427 RepID=PUR7_CHLAD|nr:phosphoribosylaminoimidazolesuccinocarboxamide synthase [Chloroflexus aggregans]B8GCM2.1 RecName: Full=Phosphoribosylaminoimidazole-succinocarboxamide synthase; AltName: Full=SAICAR synthetase [Chloroflexus aggregans DSM 9485]ACL25066.1 Phosphoribosylaminoimidazolesuccinocarboxamide synthase [Chloroflexus aggregans DSM 9485]